MRNAERGAALLEVMVAVAVLAFTGVTMVDRVAAQREAFRTTRQREAELADLDRLLTAHVMLGRRDLDLRLGESHIGTYLLRVQRPESTLYRLSLADGAAPDVEQLVTVVYREGERARPE